MKFGARLLLLGTVLLGASALAWWHWGETLFLAQLGAMLC